MKILVNSTILLMALATVLTYSSCDKPPVGPTVEEVQLDKLSGTWAVTVTGSSVNTDVTWTGVSQKTTYAAFELTLTGTPGADSYNYSTVGRPNPSPWPSTGSWKFGSSPEGMIVRDPGASDQLDVTYAVTDTQLQITFNYQGEGYSRTKNVKGDWVFTLVKKPI